MMAMGTLYRTPSNQSVPDVVEYRRAGTVDSERILKINKSETVPGIVVSALSDNPRL